MKKPKFSIAHSDTELWDLVKTTDQKLLAQWALACAERVMPYFENSFPDDHRPRIALETLKSWMKTGEFHMDVIRKASLDAHSAARDAGEDSPARSAAHAAGQAVATAHVPLHAYGPAIYAQQAVHRAATPEDAVRKAAGERDWQYTELLRIRKSA
jgi:hypothetical protein